MQRENVLQTQENLIWKKLDSIGGTSLFETNLNKGLNPYYFFARAYNIDERIKLNETTSLIFKKIDKEYQEIVEKIQSTFSKEELESLLTNPFYYKRFVETEGREVYVPETLLNLVSRLLEIEDDDNIYNPFSGYGEFIEYINRVNPEVFIEGHEISSQKYSLSELRKEILSLKSKIVHTDPLVVLKDKEAYNKVFAFPPITIKNFYSKIPENLVDINQWLENNNIDRYEGLLYVIKNIIELKRLEKAVYILPTGKLFNHLDSEIRGFLVDNGYIEGIIQLPERMFPTTGISFSIIIISKGNKSIRLVDATENYVENRPIRKFSEENIQKIIKEYKEPSKIAREVNIEEIKSNGYVLLPKRIVVPEELTIDNYYSLKDIANIQRGVSGIRKKELDERSTLKSSLIKYIQSSDLSEDLDYSKLNNLNYIEESENKYLAENEDILISKVQNFNSMIVEGAEKYKILVSGNLYKITIEKESEIDPYYVQAYLDTDHAKQQISRLTSGTVTSMLPISALGDLKIPKVSKDEEKNIVQNYKNIVRKIRITNQQLKMLEEDKNILFEEVL